MTTAIVTNRKAVQEYVANHAAIVAALANIQEFVETMPVPDEDGVIPGVDYSYLASVNLIRSQVADLSATVEEMCR